jgi:type I restriction enzyme R subunit
VGAGQVETLVEPVSVLAKEAFARELASVEDPRAKAEVIANRVRRAIHEHLDEDPVFDKRFSELIDKTLADAEAQRISQLELLVAMEDIRERVRERRDYEAVPAGLGDRLLARSYYDVVRDQSKDSGVDLPAEIAASLAARIDDIILAKRKVDWISDVDVQNQMKIAIEDELFALKQAQGIDFRYDTIDRVLDRVSDIARRRVP